MDTTSDTEQDYSLQSLVDSAVQDLERWCKENPDGDPTDAEISEIADSSVPGMNYDLVKFGAENFDLMTNEPEIGPAFDGKSTPINIIAANIYEAVTNALYERWREIEDERD